MNDAWLAARIYRVHEGHMPTCYQCGRAITARPYQRRKVRTGEWLRKRYPSKLVAAVNTSYGFRMVCHSCARTIDREHMRQEVLRHWDLVVALIVLATLLIGKLFGQW